MSDTSGQMSGGDSPTTDRYTFLENVAGHRSLGFDRVLGDLAEDGLHARWTRTELPTSVPRIGESGCSSSLLLPTPTTQHAAVDTRDPHRRVEMGKQIELSDAVRMLPTSRATDGTEADRTSGAARGSHAPERGNGSVDLLPLHPQQTAAVGT